MDPEIREAYDRFIQVLNDKKFSRRQYLDATEEIISDLESSRDCVRDELAQEEEEREEEEKDTE